MRENKLSTIQACVLYGVIAFASSGCAAVTVYEQRDGTTREYHEWQTGLIGASREDIIVKHDDGSCIRITWNKVSQLFTAYIGTKIYDEKPCSSQSSTASK